MSLARRRLEMRRRRLAPVMSQQVASSRAISNARHAEPRTDALEGARVVFAEQAHLHRSSRKTCQLAHRPGGDESPPRLSRVGEKLGASVLFSGRCVLRGLYL
jgi:hypothetical protein